MQEKYHKLLGILHLDLSEKTYTVKDCTTCSLGTRTCEGETHFKLINGYNSSSYKNQLKQLMPFEPIM